MKVQYSVSKNLGWSSEYYQTLAIEMEVPDGQSPIVTMADVVAFVRENLPESISELESSRRKLEQQLWQLNNKIERAQANWETTRAFLIAQGINPDAPAFPSLGAAQLPPGDDDDDHDYEDDDA